MLKTTTFRQLKTLQISQLGQPAGTPCLREFLAA